MVFLRISIILLAFFICDKWSVSSLPQFITYPEIITEFSPTIVLEEEFIITEHQQGGSAQGCPEAYLGHPYVYYGVPDRCYLTGIQGPCEPGRILFPQRTSPYGICACECLLEEEKWNLLGNTDIYIICPHETNLPHFVQIFDKQEKKCYSPHTESMHNPCMEGHVISNWTTTSLNCQPPCSKSTEPCVPLLGSTLQGVHKKDCPEGQKHSHQEHAEGICIPKKNPVKFF